MARTLTEIMNSLPAERREKIEANAAKMAAEIMTLQEVRKAFQLTQTDLAETLGMEQESVSRIERRADLLLSTLRNYIGAMGGSLKIIAEFPNRKAVQIDTLMDLADTPAKPRKRKAARSRQAA